MRDILGSIVLLAPLVCFADPQIAITCDTLKGTGQRYSDHRSEQYADHLAGKPNFAVNGTTLTITSGDSSTGPAREIPLIAKSPVLITALDAHPGKNGVVVLYSFYPQLGIVFVAQHYVIATGEEASRSMLSAKCEFLAGLVSKGV
jgi:hypothetical protein